MRRPCSKYYVWFPWEIGCTQWLTGKQEPGFPLITGVTPIRRGSSLASRPLMRKKSQRPVLPHTKVSGGTEKMLRPFSASGWAQVAVTKACSILATSHAGSHWSWQSHKKLSLLMWLKEKQKGCLRCDLKTGTPVGGQILPLCHLWSASAVNTSNLGREKIFLRSSPVT